MIYSIYPASQTSGFHEVFNLLGAATMAVLFVFCIVVAVSLFKFKED